MFVRKLNAVSGTEDFTREGSAFSSQALREKLLRNGNEARIKMPQLEPLGMAKALRDHDPLMLNCTKSVPHL